MSGAQSIRCSLCSINYPAQMRVCRICGEELDFLLYQSGPDEDWEEKVAKALGTAFNGAIIPHPLNGACKLYRHEGRFCFKHEDLIRAGYRFLEEGSIVYIQASNVENSASDFYELLFYWNVEDVWFIQPVVTEGVVSDTFPDEWAGQEIDPTP